MRYPSECDVRAERDVSLSNEPEADNASENRLVLSPRVDKTKFSDHHCELPVS